MSSSVTFSVTFSVFMSRSTQSGIADDAMSPTSELFWLITPSIGAITRA